NGLYDSSPVIQRGLGSGSRPVVTDRLRGEVTPDSFFAALDGGIALDHGNRRGRLGSALVDEISRNVLAGPISTSGALQVESPVNKRDGNDGPPKLQHSSGIASSNGGTVAGFKNFFHAFWSSSMRPNKTKVRKNLNDRSAD